LRPVTTRLKQFGCDAEATGAKVAKSGVQIDRGCKSSAAGANTFASSIESSLARVEQSSERISHLWKSMLKAFIGFEMTRRRKALAEGTAESADALEIAARVAKYF
jgi:hypothetical protein